MTIAGVPTCTFRLPRERARCSTFHAVASPVEFTFLVMLQSWTASWRKPDMQFHTRQRRRRRMYSRALSLQPVQPVSDFSTSVDVSIAHHLENRICCTLEATHAVCQHVPVTFSWRVAARPSSLSVWMVPPICRRSDGFHHRSARRRQGRAGDASKLVVAFKVIFHLPYWLLHHHLADSPESCSKEQWWFAAKYGVHPRVETSTQEPPTGRQRE